MARYYKPGFRPLLEGRDVALELAGGDLVLKCVLMDQVVSLMCGFAAMGYTSD